MGCVRRVGWPRGRVARSTMSGCARLGGLNPSPHYLNLLGLDLTSLLPPRHPGLAPSSPTTHRAPFAVLAQVSAPPQRHHRVPPVPVQLATAGRQAGAGRAATAAAHSRGRLARAAAPAVASEACVARAERSRGAAEPPRGGLEGADGARMRRPASDLAGARLPVAACSRSGPGWSRRRSWASVTVGWPAGSSRAGAASGLVRARPILRGDCIDDFASKNGMLRYITVLRCPEELDHDLGCSGTTKSHIFHVV